MQYRAHIDTRMKTFISECEPAVWPKARQATELGLNHEQQHQELILTDVKYLLYQNPFNAIYLPQSKNESAPATGMPLHWLGYSEGVHSIGHAGTGFCYDNETPRHNTYLYPFELANRLVTCREYLAFMENGAYSNPAHWLSEGWAFAQQAQWHAPLYWKESNQGEWQVFTLHGYQALDLDQPVTHISYYEAAAYASWAGARLPREAELELAFSQPDKLQQAFGTCWQWTSSSYDAYPGFKPFEGTVAEYNGKFMVGQLVLKGSSCATPAGHSRASYRNFFPPSARWQFSGLRLAKG